ncbi:VOC family protein [Arthrobacter sp. TMT4-20]
MLRVRPTLITTDPQLLGDLLPALGMVQQQGTAFFDAGGGRIALQPGTAELTLLGFEAGVLEEFARRTAESGTAAEVIRDAAGMTAVRVEAPGQTIPVDQGERLLDPNVDHALTVVCIWSTPDPLRAARMLRDIGARPHGPAAEATDFTAKNGGRVVVRTGGHQYFQMGFDYAGDVADLRLRVQHAGFSAEMSGTGRNRILTVPVSAHRSFTISERPEG